MKNVNWLDHLFNFISVILGVSLAFFVNDFSQKKKTQEEQQYYISSIYSELNEDVDALKDYQIPFNKNQISLIDKTILVLTTGENLDSLDYFLTDAFSVNNYAPSNNTFNSLQNAGKADLITDFKLRSKLLYFLNNSMEAEYRGTGQLDFYMNRVLPWYLDHVEIFENPESLINRQDLITYLSFYNSFIQNKVDMYETLVADGVHIMNYMEENQKKYLKEISIE